MNLLGDLITWLFFIKNIYSVLCFDDMAGEEVHGVFSTLHL